MKLRLFIALAVTMLGLSACVIEPYGEGGRRGDYYEHDHDYGRRVWRG